MPRIIITEPGKTPQPYSLKTDRIATKIGRASDNDIIITTGSASTYHCKMKRIEGGFTLVDNNSTNGIKHEDKQYAIIDLVDGMEVQIGDDINMEFNLSDEELETLEGEDFEPQQKASFPKSKKPKEKKPAELEVEEDEDEVAEIDEDEIVLEEAVSKDKSKGKSSKKGDSAKPKLQTNDDKPIGSTSTAAAPVKQSNAGLSFVIFMILAVLFFAGGLAIRHYQDHNTFIFSK